MKLHETDDGLFCFLDEPEFSTLWYAFFRSKEAAEAAYQSHYKTRAELARVKAERDGLKTSIGVMGDRMRLMDAELAALRRDKERMDWLECEPTGRLAEARRIVWQQRDTSTAVRAAINVAMKEGRT